MKQVRESSWIYEERVEISRTEEAEEENEMEKVYTYFQIEGSGMVIFTTSPDNKDDVLYALVKHPEDWELDSVDDPEDLDE